MTLYCEIPSSDCTLCRIFSQVATNLALVEALFCSKSVSLATDPRVFLRLMKRRPTLILERVEVSALVVLSPKRKVPSPGKVTIGLIPES